MSKISITPSATGTGVFTISSPATNTDRTLTLPDEAGTVLTSASSLASDNLTGAVTVSGGNVGIGTSSPNSKLTSQTASTSTSAFSFAGQLNNSYGSNDSITALGFHNRSDVNATGVGAAIALSGGGTSGGSGNLIFCIKPTTDIASVVAPSHEKMRIDSSGNMLVNRTSGLGSAKFVVEQDTTTANPMVVSNSRSTAATDYSVLFYRNGSIVGSVQTSLSATSYVTSSDYRLKTDAQPMTGASARVQALKPVNFEWISSGERVDGFLAHEAQEVVPECVTGTKDAMRDEEYEVTAAIKATYDEDGNELTAAVPAVMGTRSVPDMQGIDQSKLVPLLTAALQEALTEISALKVRVAALEAV